VCSATLASSLAPVAPVARSVTSGEMAPAFTMIVELDGLFTASDRRARAARCCVMDRGTRSSSTSFFEIPVWFSVEWIASRASVFDACS